MRKLLLSIVLMSIGLSGCAKFMANLRRDLDDSEYIEPTVGGSWTEGGTMDDGYRRGLLGAYNVVGHAERGPASARYDAPNGKRSWVTQANDDANHRDQYRDFEGREEGEGDPGMGGPSFNNTPSMAPGVTRSYKGSGRATRSNFVDEGQGEGSLWASDGQTNYYFTKNKIRGVGDIVTINVEDALVKDTQTEVRKKLSTAEKDYELALAQERLRRKAMGMEDPDEMNKDTVKRAAAAPARAPAAVSAEDAETDVSIPTATLADIEVGRALGFKAGDTILAEIVERYPNGNYKVRGTKNLPYHSSRRQLTVTGVVRGADISEEDVINSGKMYEYRAEIIR